jgi:hypothetical protein
VINRLSLILIALVFIPTVTRAAVHFQTLHSFGDAPGDGARPTAGLIQSSDGGLYGTAENDGTNGGGIVFKN